ncbi:hypothetical protein BJY04DRAFT_231515 [Aspergillus karnatakaensis]|uniref:uncharacterized protein n=1 Tax=Aspergillus karnatakaensis TaxID=1810916 RepID=UPI003CCCDF1F
MKPQRLYPPDQWRSLFRSLLRECSYLPDPIARSACHDHVCQRFRRYHQEKRPRIRNDIVRLSQLQRAARYNLSILERANQGYSKQLEKVLRFAYGRIGRRRREMLETLLAADVPQDQASIKALIRAPRQFDDGWKPPQIIVDLLKSQIKEPDVMQLSERPAVKKLEPPSEGTNAWGRKIPRRRRKNIRRKWYSSVLDTLLPPLPAAELEVLDGLISGELAWEAPKRRARVADSTVPRGEMIRKILTAGPQKDQTFRAFINGRPHNLTKRFMRRLWRRISCLVPRQQLVGTDGKVQFKWGELYPSPPVAFSVKQEVAEDIFGGIQLPEKRSKRPRQDSSHEKAPE